MEGNREEGTKTADAEVCGEERAGRDYAYFPLFMRMEGAHVLVFGAGEIAARRVGEMAKTACRLTVIAPECGEEMRYLLNKYGARISYVEGIYRSGCLVEEDMDFVFAATDDPAVNAAIYRECRHREIHVNVASDHRLCSFYFPATVEKDGLLIAVASGNASGHTHREVKEMRERLEQVIGAESENNRRADPAERNF